MLRKLSMLMLVASLPVFMTVGCSKSTTPDDDASLSKATLDDSANSELVASNVRDEQDVFAVEKVLTDSNVVPHDGIRYRRVGTTATRTVTTTFHAADAAHPNFWCEASVVHTFSGNIRVWLPGSDSSYVSKPFTDTGTRSAVVERTSPHHWRLVSISPVTFGSGTGAPTITSVHVVQGAFDRTFTGGSEQIIVDSTAYITQGTPVTVTVTTGVAGQSIVCHKPGGRIAFTDNTDGTYSLTWTPISHSGRKFFVVDAIANSTLADSTSPYASSGWGLPFRVHAAF